MALNQREMLIAKVVAVVVALFVAFLIVDSFYLAPVAKYQKDIADAERQNRKDRDILDQRPRVAKQWAEFVEKGITGTADEVRAKVGDEALRIGKAQGFILSSFVSEPRASSTNAKSDFDEVKFTAAGTGTTARLGNFLLALESAQLPFKVDELTIGTRIEGTDDLTVGLQLSALVYNPKKPGVAARPATRPTTRTTTGRAAASAPSTQDLEAVMKARRSQEAGPATAPGQSTGTQPADTEAAAVIENGAAPAASPDSEDPAVAALRARRERELNGSAAAPSTQPTTQPMGGVR